MSRHVEITYSPVPARVGRVVELPDEEAAALVREGRARYVSTGEPATAPVDTGPAKPPGRTGAKPAVAAPSGDAA